MEYTNDVETIKDAGFNQYLYRTTYDAKDVSSEFTSATNIAGGTLGLNTVINIGTKLIRIDGKKHRIIVNDGTTDRVIIGNLD